MQAEIAKILGLDQGHTAILVGAGNMGRALATHTRFESRGFRLVGIFDNDPKKIGTLINGHTIQDYAGIEAFIEEREPKMAILAVPKQVIHDVAEELVGYGIKAFLNFSHAELSAVEHIAVENVHLGDSLMRLSYKLMQQTNGEDA